MKADFHESRWYFIRPSVLALQLRQSGEYFLHTTHSTTMPLFCGLLGYFLKIDNPASAWTSPPSPIGSVHTFRSER